ncbi:MAG: hypothetical protein DRN61_01070 [Thaumarchaeota archaeon]|nr:MAG: hypothetical protein DRN61_01070 [Nitrososphaerota archaeon]HDD42774.1 hypothetical protein [Nitrososphaeria archaeon]
MSEEVRKKYEELKSKIEKTVNPYITIRIPIPEEADKREFLELEKDQEFIEHVKEEAIAWIAQKRSRKK